MYIREANGKELELRVSGKLYKDALVMFDRETGTLWTQVDGKALRGPLAGSRLVEVPAVQTTWKTWKKLHPSTLVLQKPSEVRSSHYEGYFQDPSKRGLFGTQGDKRLHGKDKIVGVHEGTDAVAIPESLLQKKTVIQFTLAGKPVVAAFALNDKTPAVYRAVVDGKTLSFRIRKHGAQTVVEDAETGSVWSPLEGKAVSGPLTGRQLERVPYFYSFWYAWSAYRPETRVVPE